MSKKQPTARAPRQSQQPQSAEQRQARKAEIAASQPYRRRRAPRRSNLRYARRPGEQVVNLFRRAWRAWSTRRPQWQRGRHGVWAYRLRMQDGAIYHLDVAPRSHGGGYRWDIYLQAPGVEGFASGVAACKPTRQYKRSRAARRDGLRQLARLAR